MENFEGYNIKLENSDIKGMFDGKAIKDFLNKAMKAVCKINLSKNLAQDFFAKFHIQKIIIFYCLF